MTIVDIEQGSEAWYQIRSGKITGTRFKLVMAGHSTDSYKNLITEMAGEIIVGQKEESYSDYNMQRGTDLEPYARQMYETEMEVQVREVGFCMLDDYEEWVGISPDGLCDPGMTEFKCPKIKTHLNYIEKNKLPSVYRWQIQGGLMVTGLEYCDFMSYYPKMKPFIIRIYPDLDMHKALMEEIDEVIKLVKLKIEAYNEYSYA